MESVKFVQIGERIINIDAIRAIDYECRIYRKDEALPKKFNPNEMTAEILEKRYDEPGRGTMALSIAVDDGAGSFDGGAGYLGRTIELKGVEALKAWRSLVDILKPVVIL